jgi:hypothetical protein
MTTEVAEVIAAHPRRVHRRRKKTDAAERRHRRGWPCRGGASAPLAAAAEAQRGFESGALADDDVDRAGLLQRAGETA